MTVKTKADPEIEAISTIDRLLAALAPDAACRVLAFLLARMDERGASEALYARGRLMREIGGRQEGAS